MAAWSANPTAAFIVVMVLTVIIDRGSVWGCNAG